MLVAAGVCAFSIALSAQTAAPLSYYPALMDTLVGGNYQAARAICADLERAFPDHPATYYARVSVDYAHIIDLEDSSGRGEFWALSDSCLSACDRMRQSGSESVAVLEYLRGSALGVRGLLLNHEGKTLPALKALMKAKNAFDDAIEAQPDFYDAYLGRGAYRYALATHASLIRWMPFIPNKFAAWQDLWLAARRSKFSRSTALSSIVWHSLDEGDYATADSVIQAELQRFPGCRNFLWPKLAYYERQQRWADAEPVAKQLLDQYLAIPDNNGYETTGLYWRLMTCADALHRPADAVAYARAGVSVYRSPDAAQKRVGKVREMQTRISNQ